MGSLRRLAALFFGGLATKLAGSVLTAMPCASYNVDLGAILCVAYCASSASAPAGAVGLLNPHCSRRRAPLLAACPVAQGPLGIAGVADVLDMAKAMPV
jgi:hypothetical protein